MNKRRRAWVLSVDHMKPSELITKMILGINKAQVMDYVEVSGLAGGNFRPYNANLSHPSGYTFSAGLCLLQQISGAWFPKDFEDDDFNANWIVGSSLVEWFSWEKGHEDFFKFEKAITSLCQGMLYELYQYLKIDVVFLNLKTEFFLSARFDTNKNMWKEEMRNIAQYLISKDL